MINLYYSKIAEIPQNRRSVEIATYVKHGADGKLAQYMSILFKPLSFSPSTLQIPLIYRKGFDNISLAFAMLLKGETAQAKEFLESALRRTQQEPTILDFTTGTIPGLEALMGKIDEVQRIVTASKDDFNQLRVKEYGLKTLDDYIV